jgi:hypothetical protein
MRWFVASIANIGGRRAVFNMAELWSRSLDGLWSFVIINEVHNAV